MEDPKDARLRFLAGWAAALVFLAMLVWGFGVIQVIATNFGEYCEDFDICEDGEPVPTTVQAAIAAVGILAGASLGIRLVRYARRGEGTPERLIRPGAVLVASFAAWLAFVSATL